MNGEEKIPLSRANYLQHVVGTLEKVLSSEQLGQVLAKVPEKDLTLIRKSNAIAWIPGNCLSNVMAALVSVVGYEGAVSTFSSITQEATLSGVLFKGIRRALLAFGMEARRMVSFGISAGHALTSKHFGRLEDCGDQGEWMGVAWREVPAIYLHHRGHHAAFQGALHGCYRALGVEVDTRTEVRESESSVLYWARTAKST